MNDEIRKAFVACYQSEFGPFPAAGQETRYWQSFMDRIQSVAEAEAVVRALTSGAVRMKGGKPYLRECEAALGVVRGRRESSGFGCRVCRGSGFIEVVLRNRGTVASPRWTWTSQGTKPDYGKLQTFAVECRCGMGERRAEEAKKANMWAVSPATRDRAYQWACGNDAETPAEIRNPAAPNEPTTDDEVPF